MGADQELRRDGEVNRQAELVAGWNMEVSNLMLHRKIIAVRYLHQEEATKMGWDSASIAFKLDNGVWIYASGDDEGNYPGALHTTSKATPIIPVCMAIPAKEMTNEQS